MQRVHFQVRVGVFSCKDKYLYFVNFDIVVKNKSNVGFSVVSTLIDNDTGHYSGQNFVDSRGTAK